MMYGLIGRTLKHSFSKEIHEKLGYDYEIKELEPSEVADFIRKKEFSAINVTIPYKETVMPYLDEIDDHAKAIGSCNTIVKKDGKLYGYNTDFPAAKALIERQGIDVKGKKALIFGTGGTSKTYYAVLKTLGADPIYKVSRNPKDTEISYDEAYKKHCNAQILVNTTPVGMYPNTDASPIDFERFKNPLLAIDAIYNPLKTRFILDAEKSGIKCSGGLYMLSAQAVYASELFGKAAADKKNVDSIYKSLVAEKRNLVFISFSAGIRNTVAKLFDKNYIDIDIEIEKKYSMPADEIIDRFGKEDYVKKESEIIKEFSLKNGIVISCGANEKNIVNLKQNGITVFVKDNALPIHKICNMCDVSVLFEGEDKTFEKAKEEIQKYENSCY